MTIDQREIIDWKAALVAGLSSAGIAIAPVPILPTGAFQLAENQISAWEESSILDAYAETLDRFPLMLRNAIGSGSQIRLRNCVIKVENVTARPAREVLASSKSTSEVVAEIRARFALQIKEFAEIVGVERPTIYAWIKGTAEPQKHNQSRLRKLHRLALAWSRLSAQPTGAALREVDESGVSVIDHLKKDPIPEDLVLETLRAISSKSVGAAGRKRKTLRQLASEQGLDLRKITRQSDEVDLATGKRASME